MNAAVHIDRAAMPAGGGPTRSPLPVVRAHRGLLVVLAAGLVLRLVLLAGTPGLPLDIVDEQQYATLANSLVRGDGFAWGPGEPTSMRPPLYPALVAVIWSATGTESLQAVRAVQVVLSLTAVAVLYVLGLRMMGRRPALLAATILTFYPSFVFAGVLVLTEVLFTLLVLLFVLLCHGIIERGGPVRSVAAGAVLGMAALTRSVLWPFPFVLAPLLFALTNGTWTRRSTLVGCVLLGYVAAVGPWAARNIQLQQTFTVVDTMGGMNLLMGNYAHTPEDRMWDGVALLATDRSWSHGLDRRHPESASWTDGEKEKWAQREAIAYMLANPATTLRRSVLKFADFWGLERELVAWFRYGTFQAPAWVVWPAVLASAVVYPLVALAAALGAARARLSHIRTHLLILTLVLFVTAVHSVVFGHSRYHLPLVPLLALYAGVAGAGWRAGTLEAGRVRSAAAALLCGTLLAVWIYEVFVRDAARLRGLLG